MFSHQLLKQIDEIAELADSFVDKTPNLGWKIAYRQLAEAAKFVVTRSKKVPLDQMFVLGGHDEETG